MVELAAGDVHLMQHRCHSLGQHAGVVGVHVEAVLVAHDGLVHAVLVDLALVVGLLRKIFRIDFHFFEINVIENVKK